MPNIPASHDKREAMVFRKDIAPNSKDKLKIRVKADATIEGLKVRFYAGQEQKLKVYPYIYRKGRTKESILTFEETGNDYLSGDDDRFEFPVTVSVENDEYVVMEVENTDPTYTLTVAVDVTVDYYGGQRRVI